MLHRCTLRSIGIVASLTVSGLESPGILGWTVSSSLSSSRSSPSTPTNNRLSSSSSFVDRKGLFPRTIRSSGQGMSPSSLASSSEAALGDSSSRSQFKVLGVCGGIGSGKSTACKLLVDSCNCLAHIDADKVAHSVYAPGSKAVRDVVNEFGTDILLRGDDDDDDDEHNAIAATPMEIDRKKLGAIVFAERSAMAKLESIVWPHVKDKLVETIRGLKQTFDNNNESERERRPVVILEAAVLLDAGWDDVVDGVWVVTTPRETALERLVQTRNLTTEEASKRIDAQESRKGIGAIGDEVEQGIVQRVVANDGSLDELTEILEKSLDDPGCWKENEL